MSKNNRSVIVLLLAYLFILTVLPSVFAATYTVGSGGNYATIQACANAAQNGDICLIKPGTYNGRVQVNNPGVSFVGESRRTATVVNGFEIHVPNTRIEELKITTTTNGLNAAVMLWEAADNTKIYDNYFYNVTANHGIWGPSGSADTPSSVHIKDNLFYRVHIGIHSIGDGWIIENNEIDTLYDGGSGGTQYSRFHGSNQIWRNNYFHGANIALTGGGHVDCFQTWDQGNPYLMHNVTIENNTCIDFHAFAMLQAQEGGSQIDGLIIRNNIAYSRPESGYLGNAFALNIEDVTNLWIEHNTFIGATWHSIYFHNTGSPDYPSGTMKNNLIMTVGTEAWNSGECNGGCLVKYNLWWDSLNPTPYPDNTNINANPLLTNINNLDFKPAAGSPACTGGEGGTYIGAVPCSGSAQCSVPGDTPPCDGCISLGEVSSFVSQWLSGGVTLGQCSAVVNDWLGGCAATCTNGQTQSCTTGQQGICAVGTQTCSNNNWGACVRNNNPATEICGNGIDEDCNGADVQCATCTNGQTQSCTTGQQGICAAGTQTCSNNNWGTCTRNNNPATEVCSDSLDNDCDGATDCADSGCSGNPVCQSSGNCTVTVNPGQSIQSAVNAASPGAVICIAPGTYNSGGSQIGVYTRNITIKGQTRRTATVYEGFWVDAPNVRIEGLRMKNLAPAYGGVVHLDTNADYAKIYDNYFFESGPDVFTVIRSETGNLGDASNVHIKGNTFYRVNGAVHVSGDNWLVEDNEVDTLIQFPPGHDNNNFIIFGNNHVFRNNYMHGTTLNSTGGSHVDCFQTYDWTNPYSVHNLLIENNICYGFHEFAMIQAWDHDHDNITIRNNIGVNFASSGYFSGYCSPGVTCPLRPIIVEGSVPRVTIEHNTIIGASTDVLLSISAGAGSSIKNNLLATAPDAAYGASCSPACAIGYNMIWDTPSQGNPASPTNIMQSTGFVDPIVTNDRSKWRPTNPVACTGGEGGTYIGAVPCN